MLDAAYEPHPERFVRKPPIPPELPTAAWINKPADTKEPPLTKFEPRSVSPGLTGSGAPPRPQDLRNGTAAEVLRLRPHTIALRSGRRKADSARARDVGGRVLAAGDSDPRRAPGAGQHRIRLITRRGFGYHSPRAVIALAMLSLAGLCPPLPGWCHHPRNLQEIPLYELLTSFWCWGHRFVIKEREHEPVRRYKYVLLSLDMDDCLAAINHSRDQCGSRRLWRRSTCGCRSLAHTTCKASARCLLASPGRRPVRARVATSRGSDCALRAGSSAPVAHHECAGKCRNGWRIASCVTLYSSAGVGTDRYTRVYTDDCNQGFWDDPNVVEEQPSLSVSQARFAREREACRGPFSGLDDGSVFLYHDDQLATVRWLVDRSGHLLDTERFHTSDARHAPKCCKTRG